MLLFIIAAFFIIVFLRYWKVIVGGFIVLGILGAIFGPTPEEQKKEDDAEAAALGNSISIIVPSHISGETYSQHDGYPVTFGNKSDQRFDEDMYVVCVATITEAEGVNSPVIGVRQAPYVMHGEITISSQEIQTSYLTADDDSSNGGLQWKSLSDCKLRASLGQVQDLKEAIGDKWIKVTPYGAGLASKLGFAEMNIPLVANTPDYINPWPNDD